MNRDFLTEAIADAKAVKESAIANAKIALEEAFSPQVREMFASKVAALEEEEKVEEASKVGKASKEDQLKIAHAALEKAEMSGDIRGAELALAFIDLINDDIKKEKTNEAKDAKDKKDVTEVEDLEESKEDLDEAEEELDEDINAILAELADLDEAKDLDESKDLDEAEDKDEDEEDKADNNGEEEDIDLENMSEEDLKKFIEDVIEDMVGAGELEAGESFEDDVDVEVDEEGEIEVEDDMETAVDVELDEAKEEIEEKQGYDARLDDAEGAKHGKKKQDMKQRRADSENMEKADGKRKFAGDSKMKEELAEAYETVKTLKSELNEINLLNAKLLYTNKIFKSKNLNESQKVKVLEAFDKAGTVKEAKLVFETVNTGFNSTKKHVNENLGRASKSISTPSASSKKPIVESNEMEMRFQKLAGIING